MRIETYSDRYFLDVVRLIENFHHEAIGEYDGATEPDAIIDTIKTADHSNAFLLIIDDVCQGILYGTCLRSATNGKKIFQLILIRRIIFRQKRIFFQKIGCVGLLKKIL